MDTSIRFILLTKIQYLKSIKLLNACFPKKVIAIANTTGGNFICYDFSNMEPALVFAEMDALISEDDLSDEELEQPEHVDCLKGEGIHPIVTNFTDCLQPSKIKN